mgnify:CR=1 FL=1
MILTHPELLHQDVMRAVGELKVVPNFDLVKALESSIALFDEVESGMLHTVITPKLLRFAIFVKFLKKKYG